MISELKLVLQVQKMDLRIAELEKEIARLPLEVARIEKALDSHKRRLDADKAALSANLRDRKKLEGDIQGHQGKITKLKDQIMQAKTNEQLKAFQHEITFGETEITKSEEQTIVLMAQAEPLEAAVKRAEKALAEEKVQVDAEKDRTEARTAENKQFHDVAIAERKKLMTQLPKTLTIMYDRLRKKHKNGLVIGEVNEGRCSGCQMMLRLQYFQELRVTDKIMTCETCGRMLFHSPPKDSTQDNVVAPKAL